MRRGSLSSLAVGSAFVRAGRRAAATRPPPGSRVELAIHPAALAFVAGFPATIGVLALWASLGRSIPDDGARPFGFILLGAAGILLALGLCSRLVVTSEGLTVRFFALRSTSIRFEELSAATFSMTFPSLSYAITLRDRAGRKAVVHANWWKDEGHATVPMLREIAERQVALDRTTARIVADVLGVSRPEATIVHRALLRKDRTW